MPLRALVAGFLFTLILYMPGMLKVPGPRGLRFCAIRPLSDSNTALTSLRLSSVSSDRCARISDFVGGFFTAALADDFFLAFFYLRRNE